MTPEEIEAMRRDMEAGTPGPWKVGRGGPNRCPTVGTAGGLMVAMVAHGQAHPTQENARRITRVPDMESHILDQAAEIARLRDALDELDFLRHEGGPQSVAAIEASLRAILELHIAHHNHPTHAAARAALNGETP